MRTRHFLAIALLAGLLLAPSTASAKSRYKVGIGDQSVNVFADPLFQDLKLKRIRYIVPYDWNRESYQVDEVTNFLNAARANRFEPLVAFNAPRGCWTGTTYKRSSLCKAPSNAKFLKYFKSFKKAFPWVKVYSPWNEANHKSQPTYKSPAKAAGYYNTLRRNCKGCTIVALDLLDSSNLTKYYKAFRRKAKGTPKIWGLHNYSDVNRKRSIKTRELLEQAPGQVWMTETGGIVSFTETFPYSLARAKSRVSYMFKLADTYSKKRKGLKSVVARVYPYQYTGVAKGQRFDAGLINPDGTPRPSYKVFKSKLKTRSR